VGEHVAIPNVWNGWRKIDHAGLALEMQRGWFEAHRVFVGDSIRRIPRLPVR
jgi:hypothetical protein